MAANQPIVSKKSLKKYKSEKIPILKNQDEIPLRLLRKGKHSLPAFSPSVHVLPFERKLNGCNPTGSFQEPLQKGAIETFSKSKYQQKLKIFQD